MFTRIIVLFCISFGFLLPANGQQINTEEAKMAWFDDAKLGIFIHWGIYAVDGVSESWAFFNNYTSQQHYLKQLDGFTAAHYNPQQWVDLIKQSGAKYTVITSKHHDGISLWDTKQAQALSTKVDAKAKQDVLSPFIKEVKAAGLKTGLYFSLPDWSHPYYDIKTRSQKRYALEEDTARWSNFVQYYQGQLKELSQQFKPDLLWFDGDWEHTAQEWDAASTLALLRQYNPNIIVNSRLNHHGDYETPEQGIPVKRPQHRYWELCYTMNDSWGYQHFDTNYKTPAMIIQTFVDCITMGGNLLLDIGPQADGTIPTAQVTILQELGKWTSKHAEAIYGTRAGWKEDFHFLEKNAFSKDGKTMYLYLDAIKEQLKIQGITTKPKNVRLVGNTSTALPFDYKEPFLTVSLDAIPFDPYVTVIAIDFEQPPVFFPLPEIKPKGYVDAYIIAKTPEQAVQHIIEATAKGAAIFEGKTNDDGSQLDPSIPFAFPEVKEWVVKHAEVLHASKAGIANLHYDGLSALSTDGQTLYLFVEGQPTGPIAIKGLKNRIARTRIVGDGAMISHQVFNKLYWSATPGIVYMDIPKERLDKYATVIAVLLEGPVELFTEEIKAIENNL